MSDREVLDRLVKASRLLHKQLEGQWPAPDFFAWQSALFYSERYLEETCNSGGESSAARSSASPSES